MLTIRLVCPGQPVSAKNHPIAYRTAGGRLRVRKGEAISKWYDRVVPLLEQQWAAYALPTLEGPVHITVHQILQGDPLSPASPDGDNVQSGVWDALQKAGVIANDNQVVGWAGTRAQGEPKVLVEVRPL